MLNNSTNMKVVIILKGNALERGWALETTPRTFESVDAAIAALRALKEEHANYEQIEARNGAEAATIMHLKKSRAKK